MTTKAPHRGVTIMKAFSLYMRSAQALVITGGLLVAAGCSTAAAAKSSYPIEGQDYLPYFVRQIEVVETYDDRFDLPERIVLDELDLYSGDFEDVTTLFYVEENQAEVADLTIVLIDDPAEIFTALGVEYETDSGPHELVQYFSPVVLVVGEDAELLRLQVPAVTASSRPAEPVMAAIEGAGRSVVAKARGCLQPSDC